MCAQCARLYIQHQSAGAGAFYVYRRLLELDAKKQIVRQLSMAVLCGDHSLLGIQSSIANCLGIAPNIVAALASEIHTTHLFSAYPSVAQRFLETTLNESSELDALSKSFKLRIVTWPLKRWPEYKFTELRWGLPELGSDSDLAMMLGIRLNELVWFSGKYKNFYSNEKQRHYYYRKIKKSNGSLRLLEIPKPLLKEIQRRISSKLLSKVPVHESAHAYVKGRSIKTFAEKHVGKSLIISMDLSNFFSSIHAGRIFRIFQSMGYKKDVSAYLASCCLHQTPLEMLDDIDSHGRAFLRKPHLPQGACSSPYLANLSAFNLDLRLNAFAISLGFDYSRYADDLAFSTQNRSKAQSLLKGATQIIKEEGFHINPEKLRYQPASQQQRLCGLIVNEKLNLSRQTLKALEAELFNCVNSGINNQNRRRVNNYRCHLRGRISHVGNCAPHKVEKLWKLFHQINW